VAEAVVRTPGPASVAARCGQPIGGRKMGTATSKAGDRAAPLGFPSGPGEHQKGDKISGDGVRVGTQVVVRIGAAEATQTAKP
jgi:hypothetical protein